MAPVRGTTCTVCTHKERERIEALRASGASLDSLARKFKVSRDALWRHWKDHVSAEVKAHYLAGPATIAQLREKAAEENMSVLDYLSVIRSILMGQLTANAEAGSAFTAATIAGRVVEVLREIGRITGEVERLHSSVNFTTNIAILSSPEFVELQAGLLQIARTHPSVRPDIVALLRRLDAGAPKPNSGAPPMMIEGETANVA